MVILGFSKPPVEPIMLVIPGAKDNTLLSLVDKLNEVVQEKSLF